MDYEPDALDCAERDIYEFGKLGGEILKSFADPSIRPAIEPERAEVIRLCRRIIGELSALAPLEPQARNVRLPPSLRLIVNSVSPAVGL